MFYLAPIANMGLPMIFAAWPVAVLGLIPIVLLESEVMRRHFRLPFRSVVWKVAASNSLSTFIGIPVAWYLCVMLQQILGSGFYESPVLKATLGAAWIIPDGTIESKYSWVVPVANLTLLIPFYFASVLIEALAYRKWFQEFPYVLVTWKANLASYLLLATFWVGVWMWGLD